MIYKAFKFKIEPNSTQKVLINKTLGCCRFIYNQMLNEKQTKYKDSDKSKCKTEKEYKEEFPFLKEVDSISLQQSRLDMKTSYTNFFRKIKQKQKTSLKFKSKHNPKKSYRTININNSIRVIDNKIKLPKLGFVKFRKSREISGKIKSVTITKNILNKYYISVLCETEIQKLFENYNEIGIDLGLKDFLVDSNKNKEKNPKYLKKFSDKLAKAQKILSKRTKGSNRKFKQQKKVFKIHQKIQNLRNDFLHKLSSKIINENQIICLEDLNVKGMMQNHKLAKSISDVSWSKFVELLKYKASWYGRELVQIDRFFPSSKLCSNCGWKYKDLTLKERKWTCLECGITHDRDINACKNILAEGLRMLENLRCGGDSSVNIQTLVCTS